MRTKTAEIQTVDKPKTPRNIRKWESKFSRNRLFFGACFFHKNWLGGGLILESDTQLNIGLNYRNFFSYSRRKLKKMTVILSANCENAYGDSTIWFAFLVF